MPQVQTSPEESFVFSLAMYTSNSREKVGLWHVVMTTKASSLSLAHNFKCACGVGQFNGGDGKQQDSASFL